MVLSFLIILSHIHYTNWLLCAGSVLVHICLFNFGFCCLYLGVLNAYSNRYYILVQSILQNNFDWIAFQIYIINEIVQNTNKKSGSRFNERNIYYLSICLYLYIKAISLSISSMCSLSKFPVPSNSIRIFALTMSLIYSSNDLNPSFSEILQLMFQYLDFHILDHSNTILAALSFLCLPNSNNHIIFYDFPAPIKMITDF